MRLDDPSLKFPTPLTETDYLANDEVVTFADGSFCPKSKLAEKYTRQHGLGNLEASAGGDQRTPAEKDLARLQYSLYLNRLGGVTQVVSPDRYAPQLHSRLTHSFKVSLLAREIANDIVRKANGPQPAWKDTLLRAGGIDIGSCAAAGLAHDLGHPPFGHIAERIFDDFLRGAGLYSPTLGNGKVHRVCKVPTFIGPVKPPRRFDGFEGNAQSFRIVSKLDRNHRDSEGLNLTAVTLAAILKYPWWRVVGDGKFDGKFGVYSADVAAFVTARRWTWKTKISRYRQTIEAAVMDVADDLTYAVHDLQDFYISGRLDIQSILEGLEGFARESASSEFHDFASMDEADVEEVLQTELRERSRTINVFTRDYRRLCRYQKDYVNLSLYVEATKAVAELMDGFKRTYSPSPQEQGKLIEKYSDLLGRMISSIHVTPNPLWRDGPLVVIAQDQWHLVQVLKAVAKSFVVATSTVGMFEQSQRKCLESVLLGLERWLLHNPSYSSVPEPLQSFLREDDREAYQMSYDPKIGRRRIVDHLCTLGDEQVVRLGRYFSGTSLPGMD